MGGGVINLLERTQVIVVLGFGNERGYEEIHNVHLSKVANIPTIIDFVGKMSKVASEEAKWKERAIEAMACLIQYLGLIKFWAVNFQTMESYTLWWNEKFLEK